MENSCKLKMSNLATFLWFDLSIDVKCVVLCSFFVSHSDILANLNLTCHMSIFSLNVVNSENQFLASCLIIG